MRKSIVVVGLVCVLALAAGRLEAQEISRAYWISVKPGMTAEFEAGLKRHIAWHQQQKDTWTWNTYVTEAGPNLNLYLIVTTGHKWADFDTPGVNPEADRADAMASTGAYIESVGSTLSVFRGDLSRPAAGDQPMPLAHVIRFHLNPGMAPDFTYVIGKINDAIVKTNRPGNAFWVERVAGDETPTLVLVLPHPNWADFEPQGQPIWEMMEQVYGRQEADGLRAKSNKSIHCTSSYVIRHRADLSYAPKPM